MSIVTPARTLIQLPGARFRSAVSEELIQRLGALNNFNALYQYQEKEFQANGLYGRIASFPEIASDGLTFFEFDAELVNCFAYIRDPGASGISEIDLKIAAPGSSSWASIFSVTPKFNSSAPQLARVDVVGTNPPVSGVTAPVFNPSLLIPTEEGNIYAVSKGYALRMDILGAMSGVPEPVTIGALLVYRPRTQDP